MSKFKELFERIKKITDTPVINLLHLTEELGELSTEILIHEESSYKKPSEDGIPGEAVDVVISAIAIWANTGKPLSEFYEIMGKKISKWEGNRNEG